MTTSLRENSSSKCWAFRTEWERTAYTRTVANEIVRYRIEHQLTQSGLARLIGVSPTAIGCLELGEHEPKISTLQKLSQVLGITFVVTIHPTQGSQAGSASPAAIEATFSAA